MACDAIINNVDSGWNASYAHNSTTDDVTVMLLELEQSDIVLFPRFEVGRCLLFYCPP